MRSSVWNDEVGDHVAKLLFDTGSYLLDPSRPKENWYVWKSGICAPCYCNCRYLNASYDAYEACSAHIETIARIHFSDADIVIGLASAGVSWAARVASRLKLPMGFVRGVQKSHGIGNLVEGNPNRGIKALIIDDLCGSGESIQHAVQALKLEYDIETIGFITITNWCFEHMWKDFDTLGIHRIYSLTSYPHLLRVGQQMGKISVEQSKTLSEFYQHPKHFVWPEEFFQKPPRT